MNSMKREKDRTLKDELPRSIGAQYATGDQWRNNSRENKGMEPRAPALEDRFLPTGPPGSPSLCFDLCFPVAQW